MDAGGGVETGAGNRDQKGIAGVGPLVKEGSLGSNVGLGGQGQEEEMGSKDNRGIEKEGFWARLRLIKCLLQHGSGPQQIRQGPWPWGLTVTDGKVQVVLVG